MTQGRCRRFVQATALLVLVAGAAGCTGGGGADPPGSTEPTSTTEIIRVTTSTTSADQALAAGECPEVGAAAEPDPDRPVYDVRATVDLNAGTVSGHQQVTFTPDLDVSSLVFRLWPNGPRTARHGVELEVGEVYMGVDSLLPSTQPDPTTLEIALPAGLAAGESITVRMPFTLHVPGPSPDRISLAGGSMRLGTFLPVLAWEPGVGWAREPATPLFAEAATSPVADYSVEMTVPDGVEVLATGTPDGSGRWRAEAVRDFAATVGRFSTAVAEVDLPQPVTVTVGVHEGVGEDPQAYLDRVVASLEFFAFRYGAYPLDTFSLSLTPALAGGIEFPGHVMQGADTVGRTTSHEVAHQWFYGLVGNNQGRDAVLDEGLASYAEARFENTVELFQARAIPADAVGQAGQPMTYWTGREGSYYRGVYIQGSAALASLGDVGSVDCALRHYVADNRYRIATTADLVAAAQLVFPDAAPVLAGYGLTP